VKYLIILSILVLSACSSTPEVALKSEATNIIQLIEQAKRRYPEAVRGTFQIPIKATGSQNGVVYLNSNLDYREPTNITLALAPSTIEAFSNTYKISPDLYFINKILEVTGKVERIRIYLYKNGKRTRKFYFQTHIRIFSINQIRVLG
jgi:hypothetical protein